MLSDKSSFSLKTRILIGCLLFLFFFSLYLQTSANQVYTADCGELIAASQVLGIPHATGYGIFCQLNRFASISIPLGNVASRMSFAAAFSGACAVLFFYLFLLSLFSWPSSVLGSGLLGMSYTFWSQTTIQEVYALHICLLCMTLYLAKESTKQQHGKTLMLLFFFAGLAVTHHLLIILFLPVLAIYFYPYTFRRVRRRTYSQVIVVNSILFILGLSTLFYFPLRSQVNCEFRWLACHDWRGFLFHVTGQQFRGIMFNQPLKEILSNIWFYKTKLLLQFPTWILFFAVPGWWILYKYHRRDWFVMNASFFLCAFFFLNYRIIDIEVYYIQSYIPVIVFILACFEFAFYELIKRKRLLAWIIGIPVISGILISMLLRNYWFNDRSRNHLCYEWGINVYNCVPPGGILVTQGWSSPFTFLYLDHVLCYRPDILFIVDYKGNIFHQALTEHWEIPIVSTLPFDIPGIQERSFGIYGVNYKFHTGYNLEYEFSAGEALIRKRCLMDDSLFLDFHSRALKAKYWIIQGYWALETDQLNQADRYFHEAESIASDNSLIFNNLSCVYFEQERYSEAERIVRHSLALDPNLIPARHNLGNILVRQGRYHDAIDVFEAIGDNPISLGRHREALGYLYLLTGDCRRAVKQLQRASTLSLDSRTVRINLGTAQHQCSDLNQALATFDSLSAEFPDDPDILINRANVFVSLHRFGEAEHDIREAMMLEPDRVEAILTLATILGETDRVDEALTVLTELSTRFPEQTAILNNLGLLHYRKGDFSTALKYWEQSIDLNPKQDHIRQNLRQLRFDHGRLELLTKKDNSVL